MKRKESACFRLLTLPLIISGLLTFPLMASTSGEEALATINAYASADNSVPAILNYAQQEAIRSPGDTSRPKRPGTTDKSNQLRNKVNQQKSWLTQKDETIRQLREELAAKSVAPTLSPQRERELLDKINQLQAKLESMPESGAPNSELQAKLHARIDALQKQAVLEKQLLRFRTSKMESLAKELKAAQELAKSGSKDTQLKVQLDSALAEKSRLQTALETAQNQAASIQNQAKEKEALLKDLQEKLKVNEQQQLLSGKGKDQLTTQIDDMQKQYQVKQQNLQNALDIAQKQSAALQNQIKERDSLLKNLQDQLKNNEQQLLSAKGKEQLTAQIDELKKQSQLKEKELQASLAVAMKQASDFQNQVKDKENQLKVLQDKLKENEQQRLLTGKSQEQLTAQIDDLKKKSQKDSDLLKAKTDEVTALTAQLKTAKEEKAKKASAAVDLTKPTQQQAYSVGVSLGSDVIQELVTRESQGVKMDRGAVLSGIEDVFSGSLKLNEATRNKALSEASQSVYQNLNKIETKTVNDGKKYQQQFAKQKGVKYADGVYSRIDYAGQGTISPDDIVTVVMKETLTDGTVISDMEAAGKIWTQPLKEYPPIFREPLSRLGNHGSITIVVPPELAYGSKGLPPRIPPGATMTYSVRIVDVKKG